MKIRYYVQLFFFILLGLIVTNHSLSEVGVGISWLSNVSIHGVCPFGGVVSLYEIFSSGSLIPQVRMGSVNLMLLVFFLAILVGPAFCGWVCPLGSFQEWVGKVGRKISGKSYNRIIPAGIDKKLRYLRYLVLVWVVYVTAQASRLVFKTIDPYNALFNFWTGEVAAPALVILGLTIAGSLIVERPWCKYLCPYGALLGLTNFFRIFRLQRKESSCIHCKACDRVCPMNIQISATEVVRDHQCISCLECASDSACPKADTLEMALKGKKVNITAAKGGEV